MNHRGLSVEDLAGRCDVSVGTVNNMLAGKKVYRRTALQVAEQLQVSLAVLIGETLTKDTSATVHEYVVAEVLSDWMTASNGLKFQLCRLRHLELDRQARGKRFDLREMPTDEEQRCRTWIKRHPEVCHALNEHPNVIRNLTAFFDPAESFYWVIDAWVEGMTLQRRLRHGAMNLAEARQLMLDMANGLMALHEQGIIRRELNPASVLIREPDGRAILTEFELSKLIDRGPTVSNGDWPTDPYRAGEADGDDVDVRADIYSWARIAIHALLGTLPDAGTEAGALGALELPVCIRDLLERAVSALRHQRPTLLVGICTEVERWQTNE